MLPMSRVKFWGGLASDIIPKRKFPIETKNYRNHGYGNQKDR
jgi:hypothetical protein